MSVWTDWVVPAVCVLAMVVTLGAAVAAVRARNSAARLREAMREQLLFVARTAPTAGPPPWLKRIREQMDGTPRVSIDVNHPRGEADRG